MFQVQGPTLDLYRLRATSGLWVQGLPLQLRYRVCPLSYGSGFNSLG